MTQIACKERKEDLLFLSCPRMAVPCWTLPWPITNSPRRTHWLRLTRRLYERYLPETVRNNIQSKRKITGAQSDNSTRICCGEKIMKAARGMSGQLRECGGGRGGMGSRADWGGSLGLVVVTGRAAAAWGLRVGDARRWHATQATDARHPAELQSPQRLATRTRFCWRDAHSSCRCERIVTWNAV